MNHINRLIYKSNNCNKHVHYSLPESEMMLNVDGCFVQPTVRKPKYIHFTVKEEKQEILPLKKLEPKNAWFNIVAD